MLEEAGGVSADQSSNSNALKNQNCQNCKYEYCNQFGLCNECKLGYSGRTCNKC